MGHSWDFIKDYQADPADLAQPELKHLAGVWQEQRERLEQQDAFIRFNQRLHREWAIETGLIEQLYVLDRGVTQMLIDRGIDAALIPHGDGQNPASVAAMINDHQAAVESVFRFVKGERPLSTSYVKEMHAVITRNQQWTEAIDAQGKISRQGLLHGDYKRWPNNPLRPDGSTHEYCPPEHVAAEMDKLIELHHGHENLAPEVEAAWLHHRFVQIHPFQDGNGRVARALARNSRASWPARRSAFNGVKPRPENVKPPPANRCRTVCFRSTTRSRSRKLGADFSSGWNRA